MNYEFCELVFVAPLLRFLINLKVFMNQLKVCNVTRMGSGHCIHLATRDIVEFEFVNVFDPFVDFCYGRVIRMLNGPFGYDAPVRLSLLFRLNTVTTSRNAGPFCSSRNRLVSNIIAASRTRHDRWITHGKLFLYPLEQCNKFSIACRLGFFGLARFGSILGSPTMSNAKCMTNFVMFDVLVNFFPSSIIHRLNKSSTVLNLDSVNNHFGNARLVFTADRSLI
mmetsp:Transcript_12555/g.26004  ORF Transcript_12555/g.26004 Transcript_12555/m.26004 type:complete len:223 (+) Transcript_12555:1181-1849(+)